MEPTDPVEARVALAKEVAVGQDMETAGHGGIGARGNASYRGAEAPGAREATTKPLMRG